MPDTETLTCPGCSCPYTDASRGACQVCIHLQFRNILANLTLPPGKDRK